MNTDNPVALKLEIERVNLLYKQNYSGIIALMIYSISYAFICGSIMTSTMLAGWLLLVVVSSGLRLWGSWRWFSVHNKTSNIKQARNWERFHQVLLLVSGIVWGMAGWMAQYSQNSTQQIFTALTLTFMAAGAIVCWSVSLPAMFLVLIPSMLPWTLGFLLSSNPTFQFMGVLVIVYFFLGSKVAISLNRYIESSFRLSIENAHLTSDLRQEIAVKRQAEESLKMALSASDAMGWSWDGTNDRFICSGDLRLSLGINNFIFNGTLDQFLELISSEDRAHLKSQFMALTVSGGNLDTDVLVSWPGGETRDLAIRGRAAFENGGLNVRGIAWNATAKKSQVRLQQERDIHEAANRAKSMFLANASHEMRTPLAAIEGYVEALMQNFAQTEMNKEQMRSDLVAISRNGKYLISLMNDFLDLSKIETSRYYVQKSAVNLRSEINESLQLIKSSTQQKELELEIDFDSSVPESIETDSMRLRQILVNLLSNAVKFTERGNISIKIRTDGKDLRIRVRDSGVGMNADTKSHLFEPFARGASADIQKVRGSGLGLALSKNLARLLGGDLQLISSELNVGSEFELKIPVGIARQPVKEDQNKKIQNTAQLEGGQVLVVDDDDDLRGLMQRFLERNGAQVDVCDNGAAAVTLAMAKSYDAILMDMKMPVLDGYEATRQLRSQLYNKPIIAVTAHASSEDKIQSLNAGCDFYLSKPIDFAAMISLMASVKNSTRQK